jgi:hypothetical protein
MKFALFPQASIVAALLLLTVMRGPAYAQNVDRAHDLNVAGPPPAGTKVAVTPPGWQLDLRGLAAQQPIHSPGQQQTVASVPVVILPPTPNSAKFAQTATAPAFNTFNPFNAPAGHTWFAYIPNKPNALRPGNPPRHDRCSVPLLRVQPDPSKKYTIIRVPAAEVDPAMVLKPSAPSCDEQ